MKQPQSEDNDRTQRDRQMECSQRKTDEPFWNVFKHSLTFYHMSPDWTPPFSAVFYSFCADSFQFDGPFLRICLAFSLNSWLLTSSLMHCPLFFLFFLHISNFDVILTLSSAAFTFMFFCCFCFLCLSVKMRNAFQFSSVDHASSSVIFTTCHTSSLPLPDLTTHYIYIGVCRDIPAIIFW